MAIGSKRLAAGLVCAALLTGGAARAQDLGKVTAIVGDTVRTYTQSGEPNGELAKKLFKLPADIVGFDDKKTHPGVKLSNGVTVYLKQADIVVASATAACTPLNTTKKAANSRLAASEVGVSAGMTEHAVACVPNK
jgi:hypothetical protein